jgi:hypothetical protein
MKATREKNNSFRIDQVAVKLQDFTQNRQQLSKTGWASSFAGKAQQPK